MQPEDATQTGAMLWLRDPSLGPRQATRATMAAEVTEP